jgi:hypothetical protein
MTTLEIVLSKTEPLKLAAIFSQIMSITLGRSISYEIPREMYGNNKQPRQFNKQPRQFNE